MVFFQGHASPGIYARAFVEGRLSEDQLDHFRQEVAGDGLPSYPHPRLLPDFWEYPTVSMGLGPIYRHLPGPRQPLPAAPRDRRHQRPAGSGASSVTVSSTRWSRPAPCRVAGREHLDNLIFVVNCNLQRLDGPVRGNGKIIQELEATFRGAGWNVIKVIWGSKWDDLLARDIDGVLLDKMNTTPDGEFQKYATESGAYIREHFFGPDPRLRHIVEHLSDDEIAALPRGGHDYRKLYAAYKLATDQPAVPPDGHPGQDHQGLDPRPRDRGPQRHPSDQEDDQGPTAGAARPPLSPDEIPDEALDADQPPYYRPAGSPAHEYLLGPAPGPGRSAPRPGGAAATGRPARRRRSSPT